MPRSLWRNLFRKRQQSLSPPTTTTAPRQRPILAKLSKPGALGKFRHGRELAPIVNRGIVRPNRDTLYSFAVFDFDAGPVTVTLPDAAKRFMVMPSENHTHPPPMARVKGRSASIAIRCRTARLAFTA